MDPAGLAACRKLAPRLATLSAERIWAELRKLLAAPAPGAILRAMHAAGVIDVVLPEASAIERLDRLVALEAAQSERWPETVVSDPVRRLGSLIEVDEAGADALARRLKASNADRERLVAIAAGLGKPPELPDDRAVRRLRYRVPKEKFVDAMLVLWAADGTPGPWEGALETAARWTPPAFPIAGRDATALGVPRGKRIGALLRSVEDWWVAADFQPGRDACLAKLRAEAGF
jgi:poly(A) polymerase